MLDLRRLRYFVALADELHFGRAAQNLHVAQPPLTRQIGLLEAELELQLFDRTSRTVRLTTAGARFLPFTRAVVEDSMRAEDYARKLARGAAGPVTVGYSASVSLDSGFGAALRSVAMQFPDVEWLLVEMPSGILNREVQGGQVDIGISRLSPAVGCGSMRIERHMREYVVAAIALDDPLSLEERLGLESLAQRQIIMSSAGPASGLNVQVQRIFERRGLALKTGPAAPQLASMMTLVSAGLGVALLPASAATPLRAGVRYMPVSEAEAHVDAYVVCRPGPLPPAQAALLRLFSSHVSPENLTSGRSISITEHQQSDSASRDQ
ncbi:LysR substrate-binding domain-containing protein [Burkholderia multivorans]|uniref:LysR substrate-binding domain-containing protein n=1 Tax=Burkholderia multivorans TaxID=87883 RepID=UPI001C276DF5|nr:LysR substrate-binding domain-containing protein [Burkholderia multivorans]MBU9597648.1 LysR family transcriptional regulator [Burkholderia multivorans]